MKYTFTRKQIVNAFNNKILDDDNFLTYLLSTTSKDRPINQKSLDKKKTKKLIMDKGRGSCSSAKSLGNHSANVHPKELEWEKEFNDKWGGNVADYQRFFHIDDEPDNDRENIKDFIKFLLTKQRTELLEEILEENFCDLDGTYDYDGIAQSVIDLAKKL